jgi:hypothetical protein
MTSRSRATWRWFSATMTGAWRPKGHATRQGCISRGLRVSVHTD